MRGRSWGPDQRTPSQSKRNVYEAGVSRENMGGGGREEGRGEEVQ